MGEHADYLIDQMIEGHWNSHRRNSRGGFQKGAGKGRWRNANGEVISIADMGDDYVENAYNIATNTRNTGKMKELADEMRNRFLKQNRKVLVKQDGPFKQWRAAEAAYSFGMITKDEYEEILRGQMTLEDSRLTNLNSSLTPLKTWESVMISHGRAEEVLIQKTLGLW